MEAFEKGKVGVFGSAGGSEMSKCKHYARIVGQEIANNNGILCTGACPGLPHEAALGADVNNGMIIGFSPGMNLNDHVNNHRFPAILYTLVFTGMEKKGRNLICTRTCDAGIFISGQWGTMNEFTLMCDESEGKVEKQIFRLPDNWHAHLRVQDLLLAVYHHFNIYGRVLCMGNTSSLIETAFNALHYRDDIMERPVLFEPVMTIMLTQDTTPETIYEAADQGIKFVKFIPIGTSTGAVKGLRIDDFKELYNIFPAIVETGMHLLLHAEFMSERSGKEIPLIEREEKAIGAVSIYHSRFPDMKITVEHASTVRMIEFV